MNDRAEFCLKDLSAIPSISGGSDMTAAEINKIVEDIGVPQGANLHITENPEGEFCISLIWGGSEPKHNEIIGWQDTFPAACEGAKGGMEGEIRRRYRKLVEIVERHFKDLPEETGAQP